MAFCLWNRISQWLFAYGTEFLPMEQNFSVAFAYATEFLKLMAFVLWNRIPSGFLPMEQNFSVGFCLWNKISIWLFAHGTKFLKLMAFCLWNTISMAKSYGFHSKKCDFKIILMSYDQYNLTFLLLFY